MLLVPQLEQIIIFFIDVSNIEPQLTQQFLLILFFEIYCLFSVIEETGISIVNFSVYSLDIK